MARVDERARLTRQVFRAIQHPDFRAAMPRGRNNAPLPILVATPTDKLSLVFADADRIGKHVAVVVAESRSTFAVVTLTSRVMKMSAGKHPDDCMLHPNSELGMLLMYLRDVNPVSATLTGENLRPDPEDHSEDHQDEDIRKAAERKAARERQRLARGRKVLSYAVPVAAGTDVTIEGNFPLSEAEWTQFLAVLAAMKPGLVGERPTAPDEPEDE